MSQTKKHLSYRKLFSILDDNNNILDRKIIERIEEDYDKFHEHNLKDFVDLVIPNNLCPKCNSNEIIHYGKTKNKIQRYKCCNCGKTFNLINNTSFFACKINIKAWFTFLECVLSGTSIKAACKMAKVSHPTGYAWLRKIFNVLKDYQDNITLNTRIFIDETYIHVDSSKKYYKDEIGKTKKVLKEPRGISRNKICILVATDKFDSFAEIVGIGRPSRIKNYQICKKHIHPFSTIVGDMDTSIVYTANELHLTREMHKSKTYDSFSALKPIDQLCNRLKFFLNKHRGFKKDVLQDYLNLFIFMDTNLAKLTLYETTKKLLMLLFKPKDKN